MKEMGESYLGDRICTLTGVGAPTTPEVKRFITECFRDCFQVDMGGGYGTTEAGTVAMGGRLLRPPVIDYKLRDVRSWATYGPTSPTHVASSVSRPSGRRPATSTARRPPPPSSTRRASS